MLQLTKNPVWLAQSPEISIELAGRKAPIHIYSCLPALAKGLNYSWPGRPRWFRRTGTGQMFFDGSACKEGIISMEWKKRKSTPTLWSFCSPEAKMGKEDSAVFHARSEAYIMLRRRWAGDKSRWGKRALLDVGQELFPGLLDDRIFLVVQHTTSAFPGRQLTLRRSPLRRSKTIWLSISLRAWCMSRRGDFWVKFPLFQELIRPSIVKIR